MYVSPGCERTTGYAPTEFLVEPGLIDRIVRVCTCRTFARSRFRCSRKRRCSSACWKRAPKCISTKRAPPKICWKQFEKRDSRRAPVRRNAGSPRSRVRRPGRPRFGVHDSPACVRAASRQPRHASGTAVPALALGFLAGAPDRRTVPRDNAGQNHGAPAVTACQEPIAASIRAFHRMPHTARPPSWIRTAWRQLISRPERSTLAQATGLGGFPSSQCLEAGAS